MYAVSFPVVPAMLLVAGADKGAGSTVNAARLSCSLAKTEQLHCE